MILIWRLQLEALANQKAAQWLVGKTRLWRFRKGKYTQTFDRWGCHPQPPITGRKSLQDLTLLRIIFFISCWIQLRTNFAALFKCKQLGNTRAEQARFWVQRTFGFLVLQETRITCQLRFYFYETLYSMISLVPFAYQDLGTITVGVDQRGLGWVGTGRLFDSNRVHVHDESSDSFH